MKRIIFCLMVSAATTAVHAAAKTWYVDDDNYNESYTNVADYVEHGFDGTNKDKAFGTIQMAVDKASSGDTILVCPGVYDTGVSNLVVSGSNCGACRINVHKSVRIESTDGAAATHIVGAWDKTTESGRGPNAIRCVGHYWTSPVFKGFTFRDGATQDDGTGGDKAIHRGGAVYSWREASYATFVDCVVSNCNSVLGTFQGGCVVRSLVCNNLSAISVGRQTSFYSSIIAANNCSGFDVCYAANTSLAHCTVFGNNAYTAIINATSVSNCIVLLSHTGGTELGSQASSGNILSAAGSIYQFAGPAVGDFRILSGSAADVGRVAGVDGSGLVRAVPEEFRGKDFYGNVIPAENALPGAIQQVVEAKGGALQFDDISSSSKVSVNGWTNLKSGSYVFATEYPLQYFVKPELSSGKLYAWLTSDAHGNFHIPDWKTDSMYLMPPPQTDAVMTNTMKLAAGEVWVDPNEGDDDNGTGAEGDPYETLQKGRDKAKDYYFVYCKAGSYAKGGEDQYGKNRVYTHDKSVRFVGIEGAANTFIVGAADTSNPVPSEPGCGPDACRGIYIGSGVTGFEGFTFRNCHASSSNDGTATSRQGGILRTNGSNATIQDCVIEASCGSATHAFTGGRLVRCHFKGLASGVPAYSLARLSGCLVENCPASKWPSGTGYNCTLRSSGILGNNYNCIASGTIGSTPVGRACSVILTLYSTLVIAIVTGVIVSFYTELIKDKRMELEDEIRKKE